MLGIGVGGVGIFGPGRSVRIGWLLPLSGVRLEIAPLGGFFVALTGAVAILVGVYTIGYGRACRLARFPLIVLPLFVTAMMLVPLAGSVSTFLLAWELMATGSLVLVLSEHHREQVRTAGTYYAVMTQLGFGLILLALAVLSAAGGADSFAGLHAHVARISPGIRDLVFVLTLAGFGSKAGLLPLHAWLPRAHPEAPSPVSALMSAAMVNLGIYGIIRIDLQLLGPGPRWWGLALMIVGAFSALYGVLQATVATDLKRLLAYSTTENMGIVALALGAATLLAAGGAAAVAAVAMTAALLHLLAHAAFKALGFLAAGSVLARTGLRDLDRLGGLARRMPVTTVAFGIAALGATGLPTGAGFVSEWLLLQSLIHAPLTGNTLLALTMPLAVGAVALTTGLGVAAMVKAFGVGFLARPRTEAALRAREVPISMRAAMVAGVLACSVVATAPVLLGGPLRRVLRAVPAGHVVGLPQLDARLRLPGIAGSIAPGWLAVALASAVLVAMGLGRWGVRRRPPTVVAPLWACGADELSPRMQYTATSFAEPLQRVFDDVLRPETDIQISHHAESRYLIERIAYRARLRDAVEERLYLPVLRAIAVLSQWVRRVHSGSIHAYLAYGAVGILAVLVLVR
jgi:formate hydrogenlyase subunit 3/multisubunit Na+/H+ antiporter MnhD subunit